MPTTAGIVKTRRGLRVRTFVSIDKNLYDKLIELVIRKYGKPSYKVSYEVEKAVDLWIRIENGELVVIPKNELQNKTEAAEKLKAVLGGAGLRDFAKSLEELLEQTKKLQEVAQKLLDTVKRGGGGEGGSQTPS